MRVAEVGFSSLRLLKSVVGTLDPRRNGRHEAANGHETLEQVIQGMTGMSRTILEL